MESAETTTNKDEWKTLNRKNRMYRDMRYLQFAFCLPPTGRVLIARIRMQRILRIVAKGARGARGH